MWTWKDLGFYFHVDYLLRSQIVIYLIKGICFKLLPSIVFTMKDWLCFEPDSYFFFFFIMREIKKILIKETSHQRISSLNHFPFIHVGYMPTSVHKLICSLFYVHLTLLNIFKDKNLNRLENELEIRNCIEKALAYSYLFSCIFASGLS